MTQNLVELATEYGIQLKRAGRLYKAPCPFHAETAPSFFIYPDTNSFTCFGCGAAGDVIKFVMLWHKCSYREALQLLEMEADIYNIHSLRNKLEAEKETPFETRFLNYYFLANKLLFDKKLSTAPEGRTLDEIFERKNLQELKNFIAEISHR